MPSLCGFGHRYEKAGLRKGVMTSDLCPGWMLKLMPQDTYREQCTSYWDQLSIYLVPLCA